MQDPFDLAPATLVELHDRIGSAHHRFADLVGTTPPTTIVGTWTCRDVAAHLVTVINRYTAFTPDRLAADPRGVDAINERELTELVDHTTSDLLDRLRDEMRTFQAMWGPASRLALDMNVPFHGGGTLDVQSALTNAMGEFLVHGFDIASAAGRPWPIDERDAALLCRFSTRILPSYVRRSNTDDVDLLFDVDGLPPWTLHVRGPAVEVAAGGASSEPSGSSVSVRGEASAIALLLYGRTPPPHQRLTISGATDTFSINDYFEEP
jgi:uncharacterized protein (TIGR03083 family)